MGSALIDNAPARVIDASPGFSFFAAPGVPCLPRTNSRGAHSIDPVLAAPLLENFDPGALIGESGVRC